MNDDTHERPNDRMGNGAKAMDCAQFEEIVHDLDRPGTEGAELRESALAHAESCSRCAQLLQATETLDRALHALAAQEAARQASPNLEAGLVQEFRRGQAAAARRRVRWEMAALGIAAAVLVGLGLWMHQRAARQEVAVEGPSESAQPAPSTETAEQGQPTEAEDASSFVLLPYSADPEAVTEGAVVRVVLSRPALASLGLPFADMGSEESVRADLVVSEDGTPQAIRLVSEESASQEF